MNDMIFEFAQKCIEQSHLDDDKKLMEAVVQALDSGDFVFMRTNAGCLKSYITEDAEGNKTYHHEWPSSMAVYIPYRGITEARARIAELEALVEELREELDIAACSGRRGRYD